MTTVNVFATDSYAEEGKSTATLTFTRDTTVGSQTVNFSLSGTATAGVDYESFGSSVTFADGQDSVSILVNPIADVAQDDKETIVCTLDANAGYTVGAGSAEIQLRDADFVGDGVVAALSETFNLSSNPDSPYTVFLDFEGGIYGGWDDNGNLWGGQLANILKYDKDGDSSTFSDLELTEIQLMWASIAEDFAPFDVNVTTVRPSDADLAYSGAGDDAWGTSILIGEETMGYGFAWSGSEFDTNGNMPSYVSFNMSFGTLSWETVASGASHEIGHTMGLNHDGDYSNEYYNGHATDVGVWHPIMGQSNTGLAQWSEGTYPGANNQQDDLAVIASDKNGFGYVVDDHSDAMEFATQLITLDDKYGTLFGEGIISETGDVDWFVFDHSGGDLLLNVDVNDVAANLHAGAWLYAANGTEINSYSSTSSLSALVSESGLAAGRYYLKVDGIGNSSGSGYSDYGSLGHYTVSTGAATLASYNPDGESAGTDITGQSQVSGVTFSNLSSSGFQNVGWDNTWALKWNGGTTLDTSQYISFSLDAINPDKAIAPGTLNASFYSYVSGTTEFVLRSSLDSFATDIDAKSISGYQVADLLSFDLSGMDPFEGSVEFRIYAKGGGSGYRYLTGSDWTYGEQGQGLSFEGRLVDVASVNENNFAPVGDVVIDGTLTEDEVLTANTSAVTDADSLGVFAYQWKADGVALFGETAETLTLGQYHVGKKISVVVSYRDGLKTFESVSSVEVGPVNNVDDDPVGVVTIQGRANVGNDLSVDLSQLVDEDGINSSTLSYQWVRDGVDITGANSSTYSLTSDDLNTLVTVRVQFDDNYGSSESASSAEGVSVREALPALTQLVNYDPDYQDADQNISASTVSSDVTVSALSSANHFGPGVDNVWALYWNGETLDLTEYIGFTVTPNSGKDFMADTLTASFFSEVAGDTSFVLRSSLDGFKSDVALVTMTGGDTASVLSFDLTSMPLIEGAVEFRIYGVGGAAGYRKLVGSDFSSTDADEGLSLYGRIVSENTPSGEVKILDETGAVATGSQASSLAQGDVLTADPSAVTDPQGIDTDTYTYIWYRSGVQIAGATANTYTLAPEDVGKNISVKVSFRDGGGTLESVQSSSTNAILATNTVAQGDVTITTDGSYEQGDTLTAGNTLTDADGVGAVSYQWLRDGANITGASGNSYTLTQADVGSKISVQASFTDGQGFKESKTSAETITVGDVNDAPTGSVVVQGTVADGQTLAAVINLVDPDGATSPSYSYQWMVRDPAVQSSTYTNVSGETSATLLLGASDVGKEFKVQVTYTDDAGFSNTVDSSSTGGIIDAADFTARDTKRATYESGTAEIDLLWNDDYSGTLSADFNIEIVSGVSHGSIVLDPTTSTVIYTPDSSYTGSDSFTYKLVDRSGADLSTAATVDLKVVARPLYEATPDSTVTKGTTAATWLLQEAAEREVTPAELVIGHTTAEVIYGEIPVDAERVKETVSIELRQSVVGPVFAETKDYYATGLYAAPGELIYVEVPDELIDVGVKFAISTWNDNIKGRTNWLRAPDSIEKKIDIVSSDITVANGKNLIPIANEFGGLIYLETPVGITPQTVDITIDGALKAPVISYQDYLTAVAVSEADGDQYIADILANSSAPWGILSMGNVEISLPTSALEGMENPGEVMAFWHDMVANLYDFAGRGEVVRPEMISLDIMIAAGFMSAGYPHKVDYYQADKFVDINYLTNGDPWGIMHELGHAQQLNDHTIPGDVETTVNIFSLYLSDVMGTPTQNSSAERRIERSTEAIDAGGYTEASHWGKAQFFFHLIAEFGFETFRRFFHTYNEGTDWQKHYGFDNEDGNMDNQSELDNYYIRLSVITGRDILPHYEAWNHADKYGNTISQEARDYVASLGLEKWSFIDVADREETISFAADSTAPITIDLTDNVWSIDANGPLTYTVVTGDSTSNGSLVNNNNGTFTYTPNIAGDTFFVEVTNTDGGKALLTIAARAAQESTISTGQDTKVSADLPDTSYESANLSVDGQWKSDLKVYSLLQFDSIFGSASGQVPSDANILGAKLRIYADQGFSSFNVVAVEKAWDDTDTLNDLGGESSFITDYLGVVDGIVPDNTSFSGGYLEIEVSDRVREWLLDPATNFGWALVPGTSGDGTNIYSFEDATRKPELVISWEQTSGNSAPIISGSDALTLDEDTTEAFQTFIINDRDGIPVDQDFTISSQAAHGEVIIINQEVDGGTAKVSWHCMPDANFNGSDSAVISYVDSSGTTQTVNLSMTVNPTNDEASGAVYISGTPRVGEVLDVDVNGVEDPDGIASYTFSWFADGQLVAQDSIGQLEMIADYVNKAITVEVTVKDVDGNSVVMVSEATGDVVASGADIVSSTSIATGFDTKINAASPTTDWSDSELLIVDGVWTGSQKGYSLIKFADQNDGSLFGEKTNQIPTKATVDSATLRVYATEGFSSFDLVAMKVDWADTDSWASFNQNGLTFEGDAIYGTVDDSVNGQSSGGWIEFDVTSRLADWLDGSSSDYGWALVPRDGKSDGTPIYSFEAGNGLEPKLTVNWTLPANADATADLSVTGTLAVGQILTADVQNLSDDDGVPGSLSESYAWFRDGVAIGNATSSTYTLTSEDIGHAISFSYSFVDAAGVKETLLSEQTNTVPKVDNSAPTGSVTIDKTSPQEGDLLTASNDLADANGLGTIAYQWLRDGAAIKGAVGSTYTTSQSDVGREISVKASFTDGAGTTESVVSGSTAAVINVNDAPIGALVLDGEFAVGETLTVSPGFTDEDGVGAITYNWYHSDDLTTSLTTGASYVLQNSDVSKSLTVKATYTDGGSTSETVETAFSDVVKLVNNEVSGEVVVTKDGTTITGTQAISGAVALAEGDLLTADTSGLIDSDGIGALSYQWYRAGTAIDSANTQTYQLLQSDVGARISVKVSYTDDAGWSESASSGLTSVVKNVNDAVAGDVVITGTATQGATLIATNTLSDADGLGVVKYQWLKDGSAIYGATSDTYTLTQSDVGAQIAVKATYTDGFGTVESKTSALTTAVGDINDAPIGVVRVSGATMSGATLTATADLTDADGMTSAKLTYQWYARNYVENATADTLEAFVAVTGATSNKLVLTDSDVGKEFRVEVSYTDDAGFSNVQSSAVSDQVVAESSYTWLSDFYNTYIYDVVDNFLSDTVLTYTEVLNFLRTVADTGVTSTEYEDLKTFYTNAVDYFESDYLTTISYNVIYSNPANEYWWGGATSMSQVLTLGDMQAGDSESKADYLVAKWFLGEDLPMPVVGGDTANSNAYGAIYSYSEATGALFATDSFGTEAATPNDIIQGMAGTCYLLAAMGSIANRNPEYLYDAVTDNGNGTYGVRFYINGEAVYTTVDMSVPVTSYNSVSLARSDYYGGLDGEMWVTLFEKAYAQLNAQYPYNGNYQDWQGINSYQAVEGGWADPLEQITNIPFSYYSSYYSMGAGTQINSDFTTFKNEIVDALDQGAMAWIGTWANTYDGSGVRQFVSGHAFAVQSYDADTGLFTIRNPWGDTGSSQYAAEFEVKLEDVWVQTYATLAITDVPNQSIQESFNYTFDIDPIREGDSGELVITRLGSGRESTIYIETATGSATESDFQSIARTPIVFSEFDTVKKINLSTFSDTFYEDDETFDVNVYKSLTDVDAYSTVTVTIENDTVSADYTYTLSSVNGTADTAAVEGQTVTFIVSRDRGGEESTVYVATADGTANTSDYTALAKKAVTFAADELEKAIKIQVTKDQLDEDAESLQLLLFANPGDDTAIETATGWIMDDQSPSISYVISNDAASEANAEGEGGTVTFTIGRSVTGVTSSVVVKALAETAGLSDFTFTNQTLEFGANQKEITLEVQIEQDLWLEATEYFTLQVFDPADQSKPVAQSRAYIENVDFADYQYSLTNSSSEFEPTAEGEVVTVTVTRSNFKDDGTDTASTVYLEAKDLTTSANDVESLRRLAVKFEAHESEKTFSYKVYSDRDVEGQESFAIELFRNRSDSVAIERTTAYITDGEVNDLVYTLELADGDAVYYEGDEVEFTVTRSSSGEWSSVFVSTNEITAGAGDYNALDGVEIEFAPHELSKTFTVKTNTDSLAENSESFGVALYLSEGDLQSGNVYASQSATIVDVTSVSDLFEYTIESNSPTTEGDVATFTIRRDGDGSESSIFVRTTFGNTNGKDHQILELTEIHFSEFETEKLIELETYQDALVEGVEYFWLDAFESVDAASRGDVLTSASMELLDASQAASFTYSVNSSLADRTVTEGDEVSFTITRSGDNTSIASEIFVRTSNGTAASGDYQSLPLTRVSFAAGETEKTISVATFEDLKTTEGDEYFWLDAFETQADAIDGTSIIHAKGVIEDQSSVSTYSYSLSNETAYNSTVTEGNSVEFTITRDGSGSKSTVYVSTWSGTAQAGLDFEEHKIEAVEFAANETTKVVSVDVHLDSVTEGSEYFWLVQYDSYEQAVNYQYSNYSLAYVSDAVDEPTFSYSINNDNPTNEGDVVTFTINRVGDDLSAESTIYVQTQRGNTTEADHQQIGVRAITFSPYETTKSLTVETYADNLTEVGPEYFWLVGYDNLAQANSGDEQYYSKALIDDFANSGSSVTYTVNDITVNEGDTASFTVSRDDTSGAVSVYVATSVGSAGRGDFSELELQKITFADGAATVSVDVDTFSDALSESTESFKLYVFETYSDFVNYDVTATGTASITDVVSQNANYTYQVSAVSQMVSEGSDAQFTITRSGGSSTDSSSVWVATGTGSALGDDFNEVGITEVLFAGTDTVTFDVATFADNKQEDYEYFWFNVFESKADALAKNYADYDYVYIENSVTSATVYEVVSNSSNTLSGSKTEGEDITFTISRSKADTAESLWYQTDNGTATAGADYTAKALTQIDFAVGETSKTVIISTTDDLLVDTAELESLWLELYSDSGAANLVSKASAYIHDNEQAIDYTYSISSPNEGGWANAAYEGESVSVVVTRSSMGSVSTMYLAPYSGGSATLNGDYQLNANGDSSIAVVFAANETEKVVNIPVLIDSSYDDYEYFYLASYDTQDDIAGGYWDKLITLYVKDQASPNAVSVVDWASSDLGAGSLSHPGHDGSSYRNKYAFAALTEDGQVVTWGDASSGGDSSSVAGELAHIETIVSSQSAFAAIDIFGAVVAWGDAALGGDASDVAARLDGTLDVVSISSTHGAFTALHTDGTLTVWGKNALGGDSAGTAASLTDVASVYSNSSAFVAVHNDGTISTWGFDAFGGDSSSVATALGAKTVSSVSATQSAFAALTDTGEVYTWGSAGAGGDSSAVETSLNDVLKVWANGSSFAAVRKDGSVVTWGDPSAGGNSSAVATELDGSVNVKEIFSTNNAFAAVLEDGSLVTWGDPMFGGESSSVVATGLTVVTVVANHSAFAALMSDGSVQTWGDESYGGDTSLFSTSSGDTVADLLDGSIDTLDVSEIAATSNGFAALRADGSVVTWGGGVIDAELSAVLTQYGTGSTDTVTDIVASDYAFALVDSNGNVTSFGDRLFGGDSDSVSTDLTSILAVNAVKDATIQLNGSPLDGTVLHWSDGSNTTFDASGIRIAGTTGFSADGTDLFQAVVWDVNDSGQTEFSLGINQTAESAINISDVIAQLRHIVGLDTLTGQSALNADNDRDGNVNISDAISSLRTIVGLEDGSTPTLVDSSGNDRFTEDSLPAELYVHVAGDVDLSWTSDLV